MATLPLPDIEAAIIEYLLDSAALAPIVGTRIYADSPENVDRPYVTIKRIGGRVDDPPHWIDTALIEISAHAFERPDARDAAAWAVAALHDISGEWGDAFISGIQDAVQPRYIPDDVTGRSRFIGEVLVTYHPAIAAS